MGVALKPVAADAVGWQVGLGDVFTKQAMRSQHPQKPVLLLTSLWAELNTRVPSKNGEETVIQECTFDTKLECIASSDGLAHQ